MTLDHLDGRAHDLGQLERADTIAHLQTIVWLSSAGAVKASKVRLSMRRACGLPELVPSDPVSGAR